MLNDGLIIKNMNLSHIYLAVHQTHLFEIRAQIICKKVANRKEAEKVFAELSL